MAGCGDWDKSAPRAELAQLRSGARLTHYKFAGTPNLSLAEVNKDEPFLYEARQRKFTSGRQLSPSIADGIPPAKSVEVVIAIAHQILSGATRRWKL